VDWEKVRACDRAARNGELVKLTVSLLPEAWERVRAEAVFADETMGNVINHLLCEGELGPLYDDRPWRNPVVWIMVACSSMISFLIATLILS